jgi:butyrate kinase
MRFEECRLVVAHIGGGISVSVHKNGRVVDTSDILNGDGPMTPTRTGQLSLKGVIAMCFGGAYTKKQMDDLIIKNGGFVNHLGVSDVRETEKRGRAGDEYAALVYDAMLYQISKHIGACAAVLCGRVEGIVLTGGIMHSVYAADYIRKRTEFIAPVMVYPGEFEMEALANGALRVMRGEEEAKHYTG